MAFQKGWKPVDKPCPKCGKQMTQCEPSVTDPCGEKWRCDWYDCPSSKNPGPKIVNKIGDGITRVSSHMSTEFGPYDDGPYPTTGDIVYWYKLACFWKRNAGRKEGVQKVMFDDNTLSVTGSPAQKFPVLYNPYHFGDPLPGGVNPIKLKIYMDCGNKINAIKYIRDYTQWGLKESKDWVEAYAEYHGGFKLYSPMVGLK